jgi:hypothetical protein
VLGITLAEGGGAQDAGVQEAQAVLGSRRSSALPDCWNTGPVDDRDM